MTRYAMVIDLTLCNGCYNCFISCRDEHCGNDHPPYSASQPMEDHFWMRIIERERGKYPYAVKVVYTALPCQHCNSAPCVSATLKGEIYKRPDGIVIIDPVKAKGNKELISSCPYRVIYWNEEKNLPQKCTFCAHLLDAGWTEPRCVESCPTAALKFGDLDDPDSEVAKIVASGKTEPLHPEFGLKNNVFYIGLPKRFIAGSVVFGDTDECAENVEVTLSASREKRTIKTNNFGDFEFDGLPANKAYAVSISYSGYKTKKLHATTQVDNYLGDIFLKSER